MCACLICVYRFKYIHLYVCVCVASLRTNRLIPFHFACGARDFLIAYASNIPPTLSPAHFSVCLSMCVCVCAIVVVTVCGLLDSTTLAAALPRDTVQQSFLSVNIASARISHV